MAAGVPPPAVEPRHLARRNSHEYVGLLILQFAFKEANEAKNQLMDMNRAIATEKIEGFTPFMFCLSSGKVSGMRFEEPMKRLVRHVRTGKFFRGNGRWTKRPERALNFPHLMHVVHTCLLHGLRDVELVLFDGRRQKSVPLNPR